MNTAQIVLAVFVGFIVLHGCIYSFLSWRGRRFPLTTSQQRAFTKVLVYIEKMGLSELVHVEDLLRHYSRTPAELRTESQGKRIAEREQFLDEILACDRIVRDLVVAQQRFPGRPMRYSFPFCLENYGGKADDFPPLTHKLKGVPSLVCYFMVQGGFRMTWGKRRWFSDDVSVTFSL